MSTILVIVLLILLLGGGGFGLGYHQWGPTGGISLVGVLLVVLIVYLLLGHRL